MLIINNYFKNKAVYSLYTGFLVFFTVAIRLPNLYIPFIPFVSSSYLLVRLFSLVLLGVLLVKNKDLFKFDRLIGTLIFIYFIVVSMSIVNAHNITSFLNTYKDFVSGLILFLCFYSLIDDNNLNIVSRSFVLTSIVLLIVELLLYFYPQLIIPILNSIYNQGYLQFFLFQVNRDRLFGDSLNESMIPLFFVLTLKQKNKQKIFPLLFVVLIIIFFTVFISNWRTKTLIFIFSFISSFILFVRSNKKILLLFLGVGIIFFIAVFGFVSKQISGTNILSRFTSELDEYGSNSNTARLQYWKDAMDIGNASPLFGAGLGNYFDVLSQSAKSKNMSTSISFNQKFILIDDPHNLFFSAYANTGALGLFTLLILMLYFIISDIFSFNKQILTIKGFIIVFWSIFIYAFLNPWMYFQFLAQFWIVRAIVEKHKYLKRHNNEK